MIKILVLQGPIRATDMDSATFQIERDALSRKEQGFA
jgi:hypothetical protein